jgi:hypothetical protein
VEHIEKRGIWRGLLLLHHMNSRFMLFTEITLYKKLRGFSP